MAEIDVQQLADGTLIVMQIIVDSGADGIVTDNVFEAQMFLSNSSNRFPLKNYLLSGKKMV